MKENLLYGIPNDGFGIQTRTVDKPDVTVVIPLYNKGKYIVKSIQSVLNQTIQNFELIIVNDGSTDNSLEEATSFQDERIQIINQNNSGVSVARNNGISSATADVVAFLDADDEWMPDFLETILHLNHEYPEAGVYGTGYAVFSSDECIRENIWKPEIGNRIIPSYFNDSVDAGFPIFITSSYAAKKEVLVQVGGYKTVFRAGQDHDLFGRLALYSKVAYSPQVASKYNAGAENNVDVVKYVLEVPLEQYLLKNSIDENTVDDLPLYLDFWRVKTGGRNIYSGYREEGRIQLQKVTSPSLRAKKMLFIFASYVPFNLSKISPKLIRAITHKMHLST